MCPSCATKAPSCFAIAAMCRNRGIGFKNDLPWRLKKEMAHFSRLTKEATEGKQNAVVMGRLTWESLPAKFRPLSERINVVVSKTLTEVPEGHHVASSFPDALQILQTLIDAGKVDKVFVVGGAQLYRELLDSPHCARIYLTEIDNDFECDVFFPEFDATKFRLVKEDGIPEDLQKEGDITYHFRVYERVQK
ncbi:dihydrofolate reductase [Dermacentor variabilis]|uniref:dihydrofolate reductase n=1 Tax=Dermacentor variabilis TaxID=34621 RepID=UPI003F5C979F